MRSRRIALVVMAIAATMLTSSMAAALPIDPPANDDPENATAATSLPFSAMQTNEGATYEDAYSGCNTPAEETVWFSYTATAEESLLYEVTSDEFDPRVWVFKGPANATADQLTPYYSCGDEYGVLDTVPGTTYYFRIATYSGWFPSFGMFEFDLNSLDNQDFADAATLSGLPAYARGANFTGFRGGPRDEGRAIPGIEVIDGLEEGEPQACGAIGFTVWYRLDLTVDAAMTANTFDLSGDLENKPLDKAGRTNFDTVLAVYSGPASGATFDDLTLLGCNDDYGQGVSRVDFDGVAGATYYFQVGGFDAAYYYYLDTVASGPDGMFDLTVSALCADQAATIVGTNGDDEILGTDDGDIIAGLTGNDLIDGLRGSDIICGHDGLDILLGGQGRDWVFGGNHADLLSGGTGTDRLFGGRGFDIGNGGRGTDRCGTEGLIACERPKP